MSNKFTLSLRVRNYECTQDGEVRHDVYQNYLAYARHQFLHYLSLDCETLSEKHVCLNVAKSTLTYPVSLSNGEEFTIETEVERQQRTTFKFIQIIKRLPDKQQAVHGEFWIRALHKNKMMMPDEIIALVPELDILGQPNKPYRRHPWNRRRA